MVAVMSPQAWVDAAQTLRPGLCRCPCGSVVEHSLGKGEVARSIRAMGTTISPVLSVLF